MVRHPEKTGREFAATVGTGNFRGRNTHGIKSLARVVEPRGEKSLLSVFAEYRVAPKRIMHGNVHDIASIKAQPTNGAGQFTIQIGSGKRRVTLRFDGRLGGGGDGAGFGARN